MNNYEPHHSEWISNKFLKNTSKNVMESYFQETPLLLLICLVILIFKRINGWKIDSTFYFLSKPSILFSMMNHSVTSVFPTFGSSSSLPLGFCCSLKDTVTLASLVRKNVPFSVGRSFFFGVTTPSKSFPLFS